MLKMCVLYEDKVCTHCGQCNYCDLDPRKICDNCCACLALDDDYRTLTLRSEELDENTGARKYRVVSAGGKVAKPVRKL